jgi:hypothetical protein
MLKQNTAHKATQTIKSTFNTMNTTRRSKTIPLIGRGGLWVVSRQLAHRWQLGCQPLRRSRLSPRNPPALISVIGRVNPAAIVRLEGLGALKKKSVTPSEVEPATFWLLVQRLNYLSYN